MPLNYPPQDGLALVDEKDTPPYTTLPLHMTVWWFTPSVSSHKMTLITPHSVLLLPEVKRDTLFMLRGALRGKNEWGGFRPCRYGNTHIQSWK